MKTVKTMTVLFLSAVLCCSCAYALGLAKTPVDEEKSSPEEKDRQILRMGMIAELDAISLYEQLAASASDPLVKEVLLDIAREEKTHIGEFQALLLELDKEQGPELEKGMEEIKEMRAE